MAYSSASVFLRGVSTWQTQVIKIVHLIYGWFLKNYTSNNETLFFLHIIRVKPHIELILCNDWYFFIAISHIYFLSFQNIPLTTIFRVTHCQSWGMNYVWPQEVVQSFHMQMQMKSCFTLQSVTISTFDFFFLIWDNVILKFNFLNLTSFWFEISFVVNNFWTFWPVGSLHIYSINVEQIVCHMWNTMFS